LKITRRSALLSTTAALGVAAAPSAFAQKTADTLRILFNDAVPNVDMYFNSQRTGLILAHQAWDMLVHRDPSTFEIKPSLATDWKFAEDNSLDLTIRQGVKFHDGSTLSPDDVVYTINMAADPASKVATPSNYAWIDKAEKTGDWTVRIKMKRPTPAALEYLAMVTPIHPKAYREKVGPEGFSAKPIGAGPYKIVRNEQGKEVFFERFEDYWAGSPKGKPAIKNLHVRFVPDLATSVTELLAQRADWIWNINPDQTDSINKMPYLQAVGIRAKITQLQVAPAIQKAQKGEAPLYMGSWGSYSINDVSAILPVMFGAGALDNYSKDPELEKLVAEGGSTSDPAVRKKAYSAAVKIATEKAYWLPINTYVNTYAFAKTLNFKTYPDELPRFYFAKWQ
jgi:ABC-type transport system substrate-binding protein